MKRLNGAVERLAPMNSELQGTKPLNHNVNDDNFHPVLLPPQNYDER